MDQQAKATFLFTYLDEFCKVAQSFFNLSTEEATGVYYEKIELFRRQLEQEGVDEVIAKKMFRDLAVSLLKMHYRGKNGGGLWQIQTIHFKETPPASNIEPSPTQPQKL